MVQRGRGFAFWLMILAGIALIVSACGGSSGNTGGTKTYRIAVILPTITINILHDVYVGTTDEAKTIGKIEITEAGDLDSTKWLNACQQLVASHVDALIYDSIDGPGNTPCIEQANKAGIKVICLVACASGGKNDATVTIDAHGDGKLMGDWVAKTIGSGDVGFLEGAAGDEFGIAIGKGFKDAIAACSGCKLVADVPGGLDRNSAYTTGLQVLTAHPNLKALAGTNDDVGLGIVKAVQQQGKLGKIATSGHGGSCNGLASILQGQLGFTVLIPGHAVGAAAVDVASKLLLGQSVDTAPQYIPAVGVDTTTAKAILDGSQPNPAGVDVKAQLTAAKAGCQ